MVKHKFYLIKIIVLNVDMLLICIQNSLLLHLFLFTTLALFFFHWNFEKDIFSSALQGRTLESALSVKDDDDGMTFTHQPFNAFKASQS